MRSSFGNSLIKPIRDEKYKSRNLRCFSVGFPSPVPNKRLVAWIPALNEYELINYPALLFSSMSDGVPIFEMFSEIVSDAVYENYTLGTLLSVSTVTDTATLVLM